MNTIIGKRYITPELRVVVLSSEVITTSSPDNFHNQYRPGDGLAPERRNIWN